MKTRPAHPDSQLLESVVCDGTLRENTRAACIQALRARAPAEMVLLDDVLCESESSADSRVFLGLIREECLAALQTRPSRFRPRILQVAAAILALACAGLLARPRVESVTPVAAPPPLHPPLAAPSYVVSSRPLARDTVIRTSDHDPSIQHIGDDELVTTLPGLSIARTWDHDGNATVFVSQPARGRLYRIN